MWVCGGGGLPGGGLRTSMSTAAVSLSAACLFGSTTSSLEGSSERPSLCACRAREQVRGAGMHRQAVGDLSVLWICRRISLTGPSPGELLAQARAPLSLILSRHRWTPSPPSALNMSEYGASCRSPSRLDPPHPPPVSLARYMPVLDMPKKADGTALLVGDKRAFGFLALGGVWFHGGLSSGRL